MRSSLLFLLFTGIVIFLSSKFLNKIKFTSTTTTFPTIFDVNAPPLHHHYYHLQQDDKLQTLIPWNTNLLKPESMILIYDSILI
ncbi:hypothetical protein Glove_21g87 [Diversispora epigaea]|uniref:Uncharacterized protein n=1 Tax=Diversispora epigaea TaxID=1348612 RepID=A0A397JV39_9GLOM|nr:hypothetical protein Glove_21g87 [Diversispora epigaea]